MSGIPAASNPHTQVVNAQYYNNPQSRIAMMRQQAIMVRQQKYADREALGVAGPEIPLWGHLMGPDVGNVVDIKTGKTEGGLMGSLGRSARNLLKGATVGFATGFVKKAFFDENVNFSIGKTLVTTGIVLGAAALISAAPVVGLALGVGAGLFAGQKLVNNTLQVARQYASGDWQAAEETAFSLGESMTETGLAFVGASAALKAVKGTGAANFFTSPIQASKQAAVELFSPSNWSQGWSNIWGGITNAWRNSGRAVATTVDDSANVVPQVAGAAEEGAAVQQAVAAADEGAAVQQAVAAADEGAAVQQAVAAADEGAAVQQAVAAADEGAAVQQAVAAADEGAAVQQAVAAADEGAAVQQAVAAADEGAAVQQAVAAADEGAAVQQAVAAADEGAAVQQAVAAADEGAAVQQAVAAADEGAAVQQAVAAADEGAAVQQAVAAADEGAAVQQAVAAADEGAAAQQVVAAADEGAAVQQAVAAADEGAAAQQVVAAADEGAAVQQTVAAADEGATVQQAAAQAEQPAGPTIAEIAQQQVQRAQETATNLSNQARQVASSENAASVGRVLKTGWNQISVSNLRNPQAWPLLNYNKYDAQMAFDPYAPHNYMPAMGEMAQTVQHNPFAAAPMANTQYANMQAPIGGVTQRVRHAGMQAPAVA